ncbi:MAG: imidazole glycerol phosphate synthase subunit HisH [Elusimicrobiota bacterium]|nr:MAG: imidazole glycerol phosphate synthase subunit HisH [Elusimicrobiota bacterium]
MKTVAIVDYGMCNLDSVARAVQECGGDPRVTADPKTIASADSVILPGVGAFGAGMAHLRERGLEAPLREAALERKVPFLGICLGMQLLSTRGEESGDTKGLGWIDAETVLIKPAAGERLPHIGWNEVRPSQESPLFKAIAPGTDYYFVHSYAVRPNDASLTLATAPFGGGVCAAVKKGNIYGVQFHPEKSQKAGFALLRNFLSL